MNEQRISDEDLANLLRNEHMIAPQRRDGFYRAALDLRDCRARLEAVTQERDALASRNDWKQHFLAVCEQRNRLAADVKKLRPALEEAKHEMYSMANALHATIGYSKRESDIRRAETRCARVLTETAPATSGTENEAASDTGAPGIADPGPGSVAPTAGPQAATVPLSAGDAQLAANERATAAVDAVARAAFPGDAPSDAGTLESWNPGLARQRAEASASDPPHVEIIEQWENGPDGRKYMTRRWRQDTGEDLPIPETYAWPHDPHEGGDAACLREVADELARLRAVSAAERLHLVTAVQGSWVSAEGLERHDAAIRAPLESQLAALRAAAIAHNQHGFDNCRLCEDGSRTGGPITHFADCPLFDTAAAAAHDAATRRQADHRKAGK